MNILISILSPLLKSLQARVPYDVGIPPVAVAIGIGVILIVGAGIVLLIVFAVKRLIRIRKKIKHD